VTGRLRLADEGAALEVRVCLEQEQALAVDLLICRFAALSRPVRRDSRLVGQWHWSEFYSSGGGFSASVHRFWLFGANGRVLESTKSFASSELRDQDGSWQGITNIESNVPASDRGTWQADGQELIIRWDDGKHSDLRYEMDREGMLLRWSGGQQYWERM
jgi:hypothetical protein